MREPKRNNAFVCVCVCLSCLFFPPLGILITTLVYVYVFVCFSIMFGPDICGTSTKKVHVIFTYKGKNHLINKDIRCETDQLTHVYTLIVHPDNTYEVRIDGTKKESGSLFEDWDFLPATTIKDPSESKPEDWVNDPKIDDPSDDKPSDWDDAPKSIPDPDATRPEDWDDEEDGEWEPPTISNPEYKGMRV